MVPIRRKQLPISIKMAPPSGPVLPWGADYHPSAPDTDQEEYTALDILNAQEELDSEQSEFHGESVEQYGMEAFASLPIHTQQRLEAGYREFADIVMNRLAELQDRAKAEGKDCVITANDVHDMFASKPKG